MLVDVPWILVAACVQESGAVVPTEASSSVARWSCGRCEICVDCEGPCRVFDGTSAEARELYFNVAKCTQCVNCNKKQRLQ